MQISVSIIIANWNGLLFLERCLTSLAEQSFKDFETIVIDNGSDDESVQMVRNRFPDVILLENELNKGFATANNQGIKVARGKYIATLNNDTVVHRDWLQKLVQAANRSDNGVGMWATKILSMQEPTKIDSVGGLLIYKDGIARGRGRGTLDKGQFDNSKGILFPSACSALYSKDMLDDVGYFDEDFFAYCEDTDVGLRARLAGWKALSVPDAVVYHHYSGSTGRYSETKAFLVERNHIWVAVKNFPASMVVLMPFYTLLRWTVQLLHAAKGTGATSSYIKEVSIIRVLIVLMKACASALWGIPVMWKKRAAIQRRRAVSIKEAIKLLREYSLSASEVVSE